MEKTIRCRVVKLRTDGMENLFRRTQLWEISNCSRMSIDAEYNEPSAFLNSLVSTSPENVGHWKNEKFDQIMKEAQSTLMIRRVLNYIVKQS